MRTVSITIVLLVVFAGGVPPLGAGQSPDDRRASSSRTIGTYCAGCHNGVTRSPSGAPLDEFDTARIAEHPETWTRAYRQLQAGTMPPVGAPRPDRPTYNALLESIETALTAAAPPPADAIGQEIADRLARLLWDSAPDASLLEDARGGRLASPVILARQIMRMLNDERARAFVARFFVPWLGLDRLVKADPDRAHFPDFDVALRDAMATETELFILSQLRADRDPVELWSADYTFLNEQLARHYGVSGVSGGQFRRVVLSAPERAGLLGHGSVHMVTSRHQHGPDAGYTSPASRAIWVRTRFLGAAAPRPFPNAQPVKRELPITPQTRTLPAQPCVNCHQNFFPLGYALENFDPIGRWRTHDQAGVVDASGAFVDGTPTNGVVELRSVLLQRPDAFRTTITEELIAYADGTPVAPDTLVRARQVLRSAQPVRWSSIIAAIVRTKQRAGV